MFFSVAILAVFGATVLADGTKDGDAMNLQKLVARNLFRNYPESICDFLTKTEITHVNADLIHWLLKNANASCVRRYANMKEGPERLAQLLEPRLLKDKRYEGTVYPPTKLLLHPELARAFFGPGEDEGPEGKEKEKEKDRDEEPSKSAKRSDNEVKAESVDDLLEIMGGLKIPERPSKGIESIQYGGIFFKVRRLPTLLMNLYGVDSKLTMRIVEFIIKYQMDYMNSKYWLIFLGIASPEDQLSVVDMLTPHEISPAILYSLNRYFGYNRKQLFSRYLDKNLPKDELRVRCAIAKEAEIAVGDMCDDLLRETTDKGLMVILEGREDRSSRIMLAEMVLKLGLKSEIDILLEAVFYKLTPYYVGLLAKAGKLNPIQRAALKSNVPLYLWPLECQPLDCRLKRWQVLDGPYKYSEETEIPQEQFDPTKPRFALNAYITTATAERIRVADYFVERAKDLLKSPMLAMEVNDFELMLTALGYLLADGGQLDCSNFFADVGDDSSWDDFIKNSNERIRNTRDKTLCDNPVSFFKLDERIGEVWQIMSLREFRSLVDSSYRG
jgi:hypothetical protein